MAFQFTVSSLWANYPFKGPRDEVDQNLTLRRLIQTDQKTSGIKRVWFSPGHVFVILKDGHLLLVYDIDEPKNPQEGQIPYLEKDYGNATLENVIFFPDSSNRILTVISTGHAEAWRYDLETFSWESEGKFELAGLKIKCVTLGSDQRAIYWCASENTDGSGGHKIYWRSVLPLTKMNKKTLGKPNIILDRCPNSEVYPTPQYLIIWPKDLHGLFFKWKDSTRSLEVHHIKHGFLEVINNCYEPVIFTDIFLKHADILSQTTLSKPTVIYHPHQQVLYLLYQDGNIWTSKEQEMTKICRLSAKDKFNFDEKIEWFCHYGVLCGIHGNTIRVFSLMTGKEIQVLDVYKATIYGSWCIMAGDFSVGIHTSKYLFGIKPWTLRDQPQNSYVTKVMTEVGQGHLAMMNAIETNHTEDVLKDPILPPVTSAIPDICQSPALPLAHLQELKIDGQTPQVAQALESYLPNNNEDSTAFLPSRLNNELGPTTNQIIALDTDFQLKKEGKKDCNLFNDLPNDPNTYLELADKCPDVVLSQMKEYLSLNDDILEQEDQEHWRLALFPDEVTNKVSVFDVTCRLLFQREPHKLMEFLMMAEKMYKQLSPHQTIKRNNLYIIACNCLPPIEGSLFPDDAVVALSRVLIASKQNNSVQDALQLLLKYKQWNEAINFISTFAKNDDLHFRLFCTILSECAKNGVFGEYSTRIMEVAPNNLSVIYFLNLLKGDVKENSEARPADILTTKKEQLRIVDVRTAILSLVNRPPQDYN